VKSGEDCEIDKLADRAEAMAHSRSAFLMKKEGRKQETENRIEKVWCAVHSINCYEN
jgi:hypothetical protein